MPPTLPVEFLDWNPSESNVIDPPAGLKSNGYLPTEVPASQHHNWIFNLTDQWIQWLNYVTSTILPTTGLASRGFVSVNFGASPYVMTSLNTGQVLLVDTTGGPVLLDLPDPIANPGFVITVVDFAGQFPVNNATFVRFGTEKIQYLNANYAMSAQGGIWSLQSDGANWNIVQNEPAASGSLIPNNCANNTIIGSGNCMFWPYLTIPVGKTMTVKTGAQLLSTPTVVVNGTLIVNGTSKIF